MHIFAYMKRLKKRAARVRVERDYLGSKKLPANVYYGISTQRALEHFKVSGIHFQRELIRSLTYIKRAAAIVNAGENRISPTISRAIVKACDDVLAGELDDQFPLDVYQAGAGTSEHMNINEVLANRALEHLGKKKGTYSIVNPHDHVNAGQSTNDVFHSALHIAAYLKIQHEFLVALTNLEKALRKKSIEWKHVIKTGRTHLRDAVPMTLGNEFSGYAATVQKDISNIKQASKRLLELNLGGTAVGTGATASIGFGAKVINVLRKQLKQNFTQSRNLFEETQSLSAASIVSSALRNASVNVIKIARDLRLLSSGPITGFNEIELPAIQPGSSIMPGKINPSVPEMMEMVCFQVIGNDEAISRATQEGELELNVMMPLVAYDLLSSIEIFAHGVEIFAHSCIQGIKPHTKLLRSFVERNPVIVTILTPYIGYDKAAEIARQAYSEGTSIRSLVIAHNLMSGKQFDRLFNEKNLEIHR